MLATRLRLAAAGVAGLITYYYDTFTSIGASANVPLQEHIPDINPEGNSWSVFSGTPTVLNTGSPLNQLNTTDDSGASINIASSDWHLTYNWTSGGNGCIFGVGRVLDGNNRIAVECSELSGSATLSIVRRIAEVGTALSSVSMGICAGATFGLSASFNGSNIAASVVSGPQSGASVATSSAVFLSENFGFFNANRGSRIDNLKAVSFAA